MAWEVEYSAEFHAWWDGLTAQEQEDVDATVQVLEEKGPSLRRPLSGQIRGSKHANMKGLIIQHAGKPYRVLYILIPEEMRCSCSVEIRPATKDGTKKTCREPTGFTINISRNFTGKV